MLKVFSLADRMSNNLWALTLPLQKCDRSDQYLLLLISTLKLDPFWMTSLG